MRLDDFMPTHDWNEFHAITVQASLDRVMHAIKTLPPEELSPIVHLLFAIRALPEKLFGRGELEFAGAKPFLEQMVETGFVMLDESDPGEIVFGLIVPGQIGRFWKQPQNDVSLPANAQEFVDFAHPDYVKVVANFFLQEAGNSNIRTSTETRIRALSHRARKDFRFYWRVIYPGSALIRRMWLRAVKRRAERAA